jgi:molecular chaperone GrpE
MGDPHGIRLSPEADHADEAATQKASSAGPAPEHSTEEGVEPSVPSGEPEAPVSPAAEEQPAAEEESEDHEGRVQRDLEELAAKAEKADEYLELAQRTQADFENYRKRMAREVSAAERRGMAKLARELLPALDNLHLALERTEGHDPGPLADGVGLVLAELVAALARAGIEAYSPEGEPFDPQVHEAVGQRTVDGREAGTVLEVVQQGYRHGETVLRPARVFVAG